ncbi:MAG TPA: hypothetical protein VM734_17790 [Kofleriaceae bacterium]|jgi:hypothetical protein|nr:hypothetical protein [Kofleriaceae bacterium]
MTRLTALVVLLAAAACGDSEEAPTVTLPVASAGGAFAPATTNLGYTVTTTRVRLAMHDLEMTIEGEMHAAGSPALFHPGHSAGGDVTGSLPGPFIVDWDGTEHALGTATLIVGDYHGANLGFRAADAGEVAAGDPLAGHTVHLTGVATRDGVDHPFDAVLDIDPGTTLTGATFELEVTAASTESLRLALLPTDPVEGDTVYDGLDFAALPATTDGVIEIRPGAAAHNVLRRAIQVHDHYALHP